jgi:hypothetical protein
MSATCSDREGLGAPCTADNFLEAAAYWREDASTNAGNVTIAYLCGHAFEQHREDQTLLMSDFGNGLGGLLRNAVSTASLFNGMAQSRRQPNIALTQLYFFDFARTSHQELHELTWLNATGVFDAESLGIADERSAAIFYAAAPGQMAYGVRGGTVFGLAVLDCLRGAAGRRALGEAPDSASEWVVSVHSLARALPSYVDRLTSEYDIRQNVVVSGSVRDAVIQHLVNPPPVELRVEVAPEHLRGSIAIELRSDIDDMVQVVELESGRALRVAGGFYRVTALVPDGSNIVPPKPRWTLLEPPVATINLNFTNASTV